jgi:hypothetical protein
MASRYCMERPGRLSASSLSLTWEVQPPEPKYDLSAKLTSLGLVDLINHLNNLQDQIDELKYDPYTGPEARKAAEHFKELQKLQ